MASETGKPSLSFGQIALRNGLVTKDQDDKDVLTPLGILTPTSQDEASFEALASGSYRVGCSAWDGAWPGTTRR